MVFTTEETVDYSGVWTVRNQAGALEPFSRDRLLTSLLRSLQHRKTALADATGLTETIISKLAAQVQHGTLQSTQIIRVTQVALNRFDGAASVSYQAYHA